MARMEKVRRQVIREVVADITRRKVRDDELLVSSGIVDSLRVIDLIAMLELRLQIQIPREKIQPEDFDSVDSIVDTLDRVAVQ
jgi:acyl carrier protein